MADTTNTTTTAAEGGQQSTQPSTADTGSQATTQTQQTGEQTFTQADVDRMIADRLAREKSTTKSAEPQKPSTPADADPNAALMAQMAVLQAQIVTSEIKAAMPLNGIQPEKVERGVRLIDPAKCVNEQGQPDIAKIKAEIEAMTRDFPEMKAAAAEGQSGFRIGADGTAAAKQTSQAEISAIFGNTPKK